MHYYYGPMNNGDWGFGIFMGLFWLVVLIVFGYLVVRALHMHGQGVSRLNDPAEVAKMRYAKGEITKEEYEQLKKDLK